MTIIAALTKNHVIGKENTLIWNIPEDMKHFRKVTSGNVIIMGRKTFDSIGKPLPNRINIVVSRSQKNIEGADVFSDISSAIEHAKTYNKEIFIIGGASIYEQALPFANKMLLSWIKKEYQGDAYFPKFGEKEWKRAEIKEFDDFTLVIYERKN